MHTIVHAVPRSPAIAYMMEQVLIAQQSSSDAHEKPERSAIWFPVAALLSVVVHEHLYHPVGSQRSGGDCQVLCFLMTVVTI